MEMVEAKAKRSLIKGRNPYMAEGILFILVFFAIFTIWLLISHSSSEEFTDRYDGIISWLSAGIAFVVIFLLEVLPDRFYGPDDLLRTLFGNEMVTLSAGKWHVEIPYDEILYVEKIMVMSRFATEQGRYRLRIRRMGKGSITFITPDLDFKLHKSFEETELSKIYHAFKMRGIKCS